MTSFQLRWMRHLRRQGARHVKTLEREVLFNFLEDARVWTALTVGIAGYAAAHASLAFAAGALARFAAGGPPHGGISGFGHWTESLAALSYVGLGSAVVKAGCGASLARAEARLGAAVAGRLRVELLTGLIGVRGAPPATLVLSSLTVRLRELETSVTRGVVTGLRALAQLLPLAACVVALSPLLALGTALGLAPFALATSALRGRWRAGAERAQREMETVETSLDELVHNADLFRTYGAGARVVAAVARAGEAAGESAARMESARAALSGGNEVLGALSVVGAVGLTARLGIVDGTGVLLPFSALLFMAYRPLRDLGDARSWVMRGNVALGALASAVSHSDPKSPLAPRPATSPGSRVPPRVELVGLGAAARGPATSLQLEPGEIACLVGPTGSGKTTLLRVLLGLEDARGRLVVDGADVTSAPPGPDFRPFAWVPQDAPLVTGTVIENVLLLGGEPGLASAALGAVGAHALEKSEEIVGPCGRPLSGGERRQVALARAFVTGLPVLLLDEPTEGLDERSARTVREAIRGLRGLRTVLIVTHREDVVSIADRVVALGDPTTRIAAE